MSITLSGTTGINTPDITSTAAPSLVGTNFTDLPSDSLTGALPAIDGSSLTSLNSASLSGALPAIDGSALTGVVSTTAGAVGTYALLRNTSSTSNFTIGSTKAGSLLDYANTYQNGGNYGSGTTSPSGTWQIMGHSGIYNGTIPFASAGTAVSVYVRIS